MRDFDHCFRLGGEEFAILVSDTNDHELHTIAERIRRTVAQTTFRSNDVTIKVTFSVGFTLSAQADNSWGEALERADLALYNSKETGRNKVSGETQRAVFYPMAFEHSHLA
ncbi:diguanylate cyclase [Paraglaciecola sp. T6c]|uniref:GGDEF domain-containing protein n=1 Tax=Pseudoalteromonas atlantica (strain T6c / ATCC BAA-1087) TaxID=3042615 RepID=UPI0000DA6E98|nr:GGDEF domain-containing protein [Paraglaciecola sp. T6c]ABG42593.1 diguanylate cyclase [Paraglaciecola sp. T6c]